MRWGAHSKVLFFCILVLSGVLFLSLSHSQAQPIIQNIEAYWTEGLAIVHPVVQRPLSSEGRATLNAGNPVGIRVQLKIDGQNKSDKLVMHFRLEYNVWENRFRLHTPQGAVAMTNAEALFRFFRDDFTLLLEPKNLPGEGPWRITVRLGEDLHPRLGEDDTIERELNWLAAWLYRRGRTNILYSDWSETATLPGQEKP